MPPNSNSKPLFRSFIFSTTFSKEQRKKRSISSLFGSSPYFPHVNGALRYSPSPGRFGFLQLKTPPFELCWSLFAV